MTDILQVLIKFLTIIALIISLLIISVVIRNKGVLSNFWQKSKEYWQDYGMFLAHPTKDFSGEMQVPLELRLFQQPTKCFSCERQLQAQYGLNPNYVYMANPTKCFSCERQFIPNN